MLEKGSVVKSLAGRDAGRLLLVTDKTESSVLVCDGKERPVEKPKLKNIRHVADTGIKLDINLTGSNRALKKALAAVCEKTGDTGAKPQEVSECPSRI
ncbi:MAG: hypothetical protein GX107_04660 [Clostridiales bacterium]|nr:hypothetical protein [Clostridiales bacterium]